MRETHTQNSRTRHSEHAARVAHNGNARGACCFQSFARCRRPGSRTSCPKEAGRAGSMQVKVKALSSSGHIGRALSAGDATSAAAGHRVMRPAPKERLYATLLIRMEPGALHSVEAARGLTAAGPHLCLQGITAARRGAGSCTGAWRRRGRRAAEGAEQRPVSSGAQGCASFGTEKPRLYWHHFGFLRAGQTGAPACPQRGQEVLGHRHAALEQCSPRELTPRRAALPALILPGCCREGCLEGSCHRLGTQTTPPAPPAGGWRRPRSRGAGPLLRRRAPALPPGRRGPGRRAGRRGTRRPPPAPRPHLLHRRSWQSACPRGRHP